MQMNNQKFEIRFYHSKKNYNVLQTVESKSLAYGLRKKYNRDLPSQYPIQKMKVVPV